MTAQGGTAVKFGVFGVMMLLLTAALFAIFGQYRTGSTNTYTAVFTDASSLKSGDSVRVAGIRVGTVHRVTLQPDNKVLWISTPTAASRSPPATKVAVRYLDLVGDRYLELLDGPGVDQDPAAAAHRSLPSALSRHWISTCSSAD